MSLLRSLPLAALLLVSCLDDSPLAPGDEAAQIALALTGGVLPGSVVEARVFWIDPAQGQQRELTEVTLAAIRVATDSATLRIPLVVDLRPCLPRERQASPAWCDVFVEVKLWEGSVLLTQQVERPVRLSAGATATAPRMYVAQGNSPPTLALIEAAQRVDPGLIRVRVSATDADGDLITLEADLRDSFGVVNGSTVVRLAAPLACSRSRCTCPSPKRSRSATSRWRRATPVGTPALRPPPSWLPSSSCWLRRPATWRAPSWTPAWTSPSSFDPQGDAEVVDVVFRNLVDGEIVVADTVYGTCRRAVSLGNGRKSVSCPRIPGVGPAMVVVVPFDLAANWGRAARCAMTASTTSFSCTAR